MISIELKGEREVLRHLSTFDPNAIFNHVLGRHMTQMQIELQRYPSARPGSRYQRTGKLGRGWKLQRQGKGELALTNMTSYAQYVQGQRQARWHQGRWKTSEQVLAHYRPRIRASIEDEIRKWVKS